MKAEIGNSRGIRLSKAVVEQSGLNGDVELEAGDRQTIIHIARKPRDGWENKSSAMAENADDDLLDKEALPRQSQWDDNEWTW